MKFDPEILIAEARKREAARRNEELRRRLVHRTTLDEDLSFLYSMKGLNVGERERRELVC